MSSLVPEGWEETPLGNVADIYSGGTPSRSDDSNYNGKIPWVKSGEVNQRTVLGTSETISERALASSSAKWVEKGSVLVAMYGATAGKVAKLMIRATINQAIAAVSAMPTRVSNDYLFHEVEFKSRKLLDSVQGSGQPNLSGQIVKELKVSVPPLPEQKKIASILTSVDEVIENTQKQIDKLQDLKKATMNELLTKGIGHTEFKYSELGQIPKSWEVESLDEISTRVTDGTHQTVKTSDNGTIPFLYVSTVRDQKINWGIAGKITEEEYSKASQGRQPNLGDILYTAVGSYGYAAIVDTDSKFCFQRHIALIQLNQKVVSPKFIENFLVSDTAKRQADRLVVGNAQLTLTLGELKKFSVPLPSIQEQQTINNILNPLSEYILRLGKKVSHTQSLKKSLMQDLLTGKVRVTVN